MKVNNPQTTLTTAIVAFIGVALGWMATKSQAAMEDFHIDMEVYRAGGKAILEGSPLYDHWFQAGNIELPFTYPPFGAIILTPLSVFDFMDAQDASIVMIYLSSLLLLFCLYLIAHTLFKQPGFNLSALVLAGIVWPVALLTEPLWKNAVYTQVNVLIMTLIVLDVVPRKRKIPQGWLIGIAAAIKLTPLVMLLFFLARRDWRAICTSVASLLIATGLAALLRPKDTWAYFTSVLYDVNRIGDVGYATNGSLKGAITRFWPSKQAALDAGTTINIIWFFCSAVAIIGVYYVVRALLNRGLLIDAALATSALMLLISPISWSHHWVWLPTWALVFAWRWWHAPNHPRALFAAALAIAVLTLFTPPHWWFGDYFGVEYTFSVWKKIFVMDYTLLAISLLAIAGWGAHKIPISSED